LQPPPLAATTKGTQMKLSSVPHRITTYVDHETGYIFEKFTKDLPRGQTGTRCYHNKVLIGECTFVRKYSRLEGGKQSFNLMIDQMKLNDSYDKYLAHCQSTESKPIISLEGLRAMLKSAWPLMYQLEGVTGKGTVFSVEYIDETNRNWKTYFA